MLKALGEAESGGVPYTSDANEGRMYIQARGARHSQRRGDPFQALRSQQRQMELHGNMGGHGGGRRQRRHSLSSVAEGRTSRPVYEAYPSDAEQLMLVKRANSRGALLATSGSFTVRPRPQKHFLGTSVAGTAHFPSIEAADQVGITLNRLRTNTSVPRGRRQSYQAHAASVCEDGCISPALAAYGLNTADAAAFANNFLQQQPQLPASLMLKAPHGQPHTVQGDSGLAPCYPSHLEAAPRASHGTPIKSWNGASGHQAFVDHTCEWRSPSRSPWPADCRS